MSDPTTYDLVKPYEKKLEEAENALLGEDYRKAAATLGTVVVAAATGHPELGVLAPFVNKAIVRAFESAADAQMRVQMEAFAEEDDRKAFVAQITEATAELLEEAVLMLAKIQHRATEQTAAQVGAAREELRAFRETFERELSAADAVRVETMHVTAGGLGIRVGASTRKRAFVGTMNVNGKGSVGIDMT